MVFRNGKLQIMVATILTSAFATVAHAEIACPGVAAVKDAVGSLNTVMRQSEDGRNFFVLGAQAAINESGLDWILVSQTQANSFDPAFANGQSNVKTVTMPLSDAPMEMNGVYVCGYLTSSGGMTVMTVAPKKEGTIINPITLKLDTVKFNK